MLGEIAVSRAGTGKVQDEPEHFVTKSKELLKTNQNLKKKKEDITKGHVEPAQRTSHWTSQTQLERGK